jgi:hypothetical protein
MSGTLRTLLFVENPFENQIGSKNSASLYSPQRRRLTKDTSQSFRMASTTRADSA